MPELLPCRPSFPVQVRRQGGVLAGRPQVPGRGEDDLAVHVQTRRRGEVLDVCPQVPGRVGEVVAIQVPGRIDAAVVRGRLQLARGLAFAMISGRVARLARVPVAGSDGAEVSPGQTSDQLLARYVPRGIAGGNGAGVDPGQAAYPPLLTGVGKG